MSNAEKTLQRVGNVLIGWGVFDLVTMVFNFILSEGKVNIPVFDLFAIGWGMGFRRGKPHSIPTVSTIIVIMLGKAAGSSLFHFMIPLKYMFAWVYVYPMRFFKEEAYYIASVVLLIWMYSSLSTPTVVAAMAEVGIDVRKHFRRLKAGFLISGLVVALLTVDGFGFSGLADRAKAIERARSHFGPQYDYFVTDLSINDERDTRKVKAKVAAYTCWEIRTVEFEWQE